MFKLAPSILAADFGELAREARRAEEGGADQIHVDVMDGHFVDNISMGPAAVESLRRAVRVPLDVHLMITRPLGFLQTFVRAGADSISFHLEADDDPRECIQRLRELRVGVGLAISPDTPVQGALELVPLVDMIVVMTVYPGFAGQEFLARALAKIPPLRDAARKASRELDVEVDGGIGPATILEAARAGANVFVAGSSVFGKPPAAPRDPARGLKELREALEEAC